MFLHGALHIVSNLCRRRAAGGVTQGVEVSDNAIGDFTVLDSAVMKGRIQEAGAKVAMIAVRADQAQEVANQLVEAGVQAILNYAPVNITVPLDVKVQHIDPAVHLQHMTYYLD